MMVPMMIMVVVVMFMIPVMIVVMMLVILIVVMVVMFMIPVMVMVMMVFMILIMVMVVMVMILIMVMVVVFMILIMVMVVMLMIMNILGFFLFPLHFNHHMRSRESALYSRFLFHRNTRDQGVHFFKKGLFLFIGKKFQECSREHIASSTHSAFNVQCLHVDCLRFSVCLLL